MTNENDLFNEFDIDKEDALNILRLQRQLLIEENILFTFEECVNIWLRYSSDLCASWLDFPKKDESITHYIKELNHYFTSFEDYAKNL